MKKISEPYAKIIMITVISVILGLLILTIFRTFIASHYQNRYLSLSQEANHITEQIYHFSDSEKQTYDALSHALTDLEVETNKASSELQKLSQALPSKLALVPPVSISNATQLQNDVAKYTDSINSLLGAKVSGIYADQTIRELHTQLMADYPDNNDQVNLFQSIYYLRHDFNPQTQMEETSKLKHDPRYHRLLNYIALKSRVKESINKEEKMLSEFHIQASLDKVNNYWMQAVVKTKMNVVYTALTLLLTIGLYLFWLQRKEHKLVNAAQLKLLESEKQRSQLGLLLAHAQDAIVITDKHGVITWTNKGFANLSGYSIEMSIGKTLTQLLESPATASQQLNKLQHALSKGAILQDELEVQHSDGHSYWIDLILTPIFDNTGSLDSFIAVERDVTKRRELEFSLAQSAEQAKSSNKAKSTFLATMSHELRTPLNGIMGMAQIIENACQDSTQKQQLNILLESSNHLLSLLNDILDFSKIEQNKLELEALPFRFDDITAPILSTYTALCQDKGIELIIENNIPKYATFSGDKARIRQIIFNLLSNAVKFTTKGEIRLIFTEQPTDLNNTTAKDSTIGITIQDSGVGIPQDRLTHIFDPFVQAESSTTRKFGGTGLGLAIVKQLVELMQGHIKIDSEINVGTSFIIDLQLDYTEEKPAELQGQHDLNKQVLAQSLDILIVEDNRVNALVAKTFCQKQGHKVTVAEDGSIAIKVVQEQCFDLIIMDNHMPEMDGITATKYMRQTLNMDTIIFGCTADVFKEAHDNFIDAGVDHVLTKPLQKESFIDALLLFQQKLADKSQANEIQENVVEMALYRPQDHTQKQYTEAEISFAFINDLCEQDSETSLALIASFESTTTAKIEALITAYEDENSKDIYRQAHAVQGEAGTLNITKLANKARAIAEQAQQGKLPELKPMQELLNLLDVNAHQALRILAEHKPVKHNHSQSHNS